MTLCFSTLPRPPFSTSLHGLIHLPPSSWKSLLGLEIVQQHVPLLALLAPIPNDDAAAVDNLSGISLAVEHAQAGPLAQHLSIRHLNQGDLVFRAKSNDEFLVGFFFTRFVEDAHVCLTAIEGFAGFTEATSETVVDEGEFEDA